MVIAVSGAKDLPKYLVTSAQDATYAVEEELVEEGAGVCQSETRGLLQVTLRG